MKLGLITDIHEHNEYLRTALDRFHSEGVDQVIVIGDLFELGRHIQETCQLLQQVNAIGVWGNHDYGLCVNPTAEVRRKYGDAVITFATTLRPHLEVADCHFMHIEPWLDPNDLSDLWYFDGPPDQPDKLERIFAAVPHRLLFAGHYHRWLMATPEGLLDWGGKQPIKLSQGRFFIVIGALCLGRYAILDLDTSELLPFNETI